VAALTAVARHSDPDRDATLRPMAWRRMAWVTWRQHRSALSGAAALLGVVAIILWIEGVALHHDFAAATSCHPAASAICASLATTFNGVGGFLANGLVLQVVPALIGAFVGAPVLARELESGTFRFAWTQGFGRVRWALAKLVALGVAVAAGAGALGALTYWYYGPYFAAGVSGSSTSKAGMIGATPFSIGLFDVRGVMLAAWTLAAFAIGVLAGALIRRVVPAIAATLAAYAGLALATGGWLRQHYMTPLVTSRLTVPGSAWIISQPWTKAGRVVSPSVIDQVLASAPASVAGKGGIPDSFNTVRYLAQHGYTRLTIYQPVSRFWTFQWIEVGWLLALSALLIAASVWMVRRRAI
jgi:ABC-type transport system involved in multi-copper enzyme maturation permease subunit